jgi:hypothetical protein
LKKVNLKKMIGLDDFILDAVFQPQHQSLFSLVGDIIPEDKSDIEVSDIQDPELLNRLQQKEFLAIRLQNQGKSEEALQILDAIFYENPTFYSCLNNKLVINMK